MKIKVISTQSKDDNGKAKIFTDSDGATVLRSYSTDVAKITKNGDFVRLWSGYSSTTQKHINDFRTQNGFGKLSKKEWLSIPCINEENTYKITISNGFFEHTGAAQLTRSEANKEVDKIHTARKNVYVWMEEN